MGTGLRARKKQRTRDTIVREALALFSERGFDGVTVADIAAAADIAPRTFFAYFPAKDDVVFADMPEDLGDLKRRLADRPDGAATFDVLDAWIADLLATHDLDAPQERQRRTLVRETPALQARHAAKMAEFAACIADGVAADLGAPPGDLRPRIVAAAATAVLTALDESDDPPGTDAGANALLDEALDFLRGGLAALQARTPTPSRPD